MFAKVGEYSSLQQGCSHHTVLCTHICEHLCIEYVYTEIYLAHICVFGIYNTILLWIAGVCRCALLFSNGSWELSVPIITIWWRTDRNLLPFYDNVIYTRLYTYVHDSLIYTWNS